MLRRFTGWAEHCDFWRRTSMGSDDGPETVGSADIHVGCAGWNIPKDHAARFPEQGSHLSRYAQRFPAVEINSSFYRSHRSSTYARWAAGTPKGFQFAVKVPKEITHERRLLGCAEPVERFLGETAALGAKRGPLLVQLPPTLAFSARVSGAFFTMLRDRYNGAVVCEPRHPAWFAPVPDRLLFDLSVARVAADPAILPGAGEPGAWDGLAYFRLHGSPEMYYSAYSGAYLEHLAGQLNHALSHGPVWCVFDNTARGWATVNGLELLDILRRG
jgi:uncharacterized protein YecE (DUF72 family)